MTKQERCLYYGTTVPIAIFIILGAQIGGLIALVLGFLVAVSGHIAGYVYGMADSRKRAPDA